MGSGCSAAGPEGQGQGQVPCAGLPSRGVPAGADGELGGMRLGLCSVKPRSSSARLCTGFPRDTEPRWDSAVRGRCAEEGREEGRQG